VDGLNGYTADVGDNETLVAAIVGLAQSPDKKDEVRRNGRLTISKRSWRRALGPLEAVYDELIERRRNMGERVPRPTWMANPEGLTRASCAADALLNVYTRVRKGSMKTTKGVRMLHEMLSDQSIVDVIKGATMIRRYRPELHVGAE
jgi:hypothetical protein